MKNQISSIFQSLTKTMILRRLGNKSKIAKKIQVHFPRHYIYIEPFFGAGGMFFNKPKSKYNVLNDIDSDVYNLFQVVSNKKSELEAAFKAMPIHQKLWEYWKNNQETDPIKKSLRFLFLSNYGYLGQSETLRYLSGNTSKLLYENIERTNAFIFGCEFMSTDFRDIFKKLPFKNKKEKFNTFVYCDLPYLETNNNYQQGFSKQDSLDLFDVLENSGVHFAMSEFDNPFILDQAKQRGLNIIAIGERRNLKNRRLEILITNYKPAQLSFL